MSCSAVNCTNRSGQGVRLFRFPAQLERRQIWINNTRRTQWQPRETSRLCEVHFEENQFERKRMDGWIKLKWDAIPTIFNVPNPPKRVMTKRKSKYKILDPPLDVQPNEIENTTGASMQSLPSIPDDTTLSVGPNEFENTTDENTQLFQSSLQMENEALRKENDRLKRANEQFVKYREQTNENFKQQLEDQSKLLETFKTTMYGTATQKKRKI
ncbi:unnamed protein product [Macrosiphum euphorbiae]|uniref:THAP-type domain-containing protein n=1 Tax=Macrosiphum euphorbiae TaxID=13131 RepID=A0AAV0VUB6_9HEMI|nr:unnamed protein product [Macrosiphum euphorbiae]